MRRVCVTGFALLGLWLVGTIHAEDFTVRKASKAPPEQVTESIRNVIQPEGIALFSGGKPVLEVWLVKEVQLKSKSSSVDALKDTALTGVISVSSDQFKDYKDNSISKGIYTLRFLTQPQDGDHLGTAEYNSFVALLPADVDKEPAAFSKYTPTVKASGKLTSSGHPQILSLRPAASAGAVVPAVVDPAADHKAIRLNIPGRSPEGEKSEVTCDLVFQGHGHIQ